MMQIEVRKLRDEDIAALAEIEAKTFSMPWSEQDFRNLLSHSYCRYLVALADGQVAGGCGYTDSFQEATIDNVVVSERFRNHGIGQRMLEELILLGENEGIEAFTLEVRVSNEAAIRLYEKFGFRSEGIRPGFYERPREDALIMWRRRNPVDALG